jgi:hypothetical protein
MVQRSRYWKAGFYTDRVSKVLIVLLSYCPANERQARTRINLSLLRGCLGVFVPVPNHERLLDIHSLEQQSQPG